MKKGSYRNFFKAFLDVANLCIAILAVIGLLVSVGFFRFRIEPTIKLLKPFYVFDMSKMVEAVRANAPQIPIPPEWLKLTNSLVYLRGTNLASIRFGKLICPFSYAYNLSTNFADEYLVKQTDPPAYFYQLGVATAPSNYVDAIPGFSSERSDEDKRNSVWMTGVFLDSCFLASERGLNPGDAIDQNPLTKLQEVMPHNPLPQFGDSVRLGKISEATCVYSILSVANPHSEPIENIRISVANSQFTGPVTLIGWSNIPQIVESVERNNNYHVTIERLDPNQSIEIVFRGHKMLHENDVAIACAWTFDKIKVGVSVLVTFLATLGLYLGDHLHAIVKSSFIRGARFMNRRIASFKTAAKRARSQDKGD
jgi:hypothetical protein